MRILIVTEDLPATNIGGAGKHAVLLANTLIDAGHHVEMLGCSGANAAAEKIGFKGRFHARIDLSHTGWKEHVIGAFLAVRRMHQSRRIWNAIREIGGSWDVVHYHGHTPMLGALVPATVNFVHTLHDQGGECMIKIRLRDNVPCEEVDPRACAGCATKNPNRLQTAISAHAVRQYRATAVRAFTRHKTIFVSRFIAQRFGEITESTGKNRSHVVHNFVDLKKIRTVLEAASKSTIRQSAKLGVLMAGRIDKSKGFGALLSCFSSEQFAQLAITVIGDGPDLANLRNRFTGAGVVFLGWQPLETVIEEAVRADVCVTPTTCEEACPTTVLEGLAVGRTVFALELGGTPELVRYERFPGQLRLFKDVQSMANALVALRPTQVRGHAMGEPGGDVLDHLADILAIYRERYSNIEPIRGEAV